MSITAVQRFSCTQLPCWLIPAVLGNPQTPPGQEGHEKKPPPPKKSFCWFTSLFHMRPRFHLQFGQLARCRGLCPWGLPTPKMTAFCHEPTIWHFANFASTWIHLDAQHFAEDISSLAGALRLSTFRKIFHAPSSPAGLSPDNSMHRQPLCPSEKKKVVQEAKPTVSRRPLLKKKWGSGPRGIAHSFKKATIKKKKKKKNNFSTPPT